MSLDIARLRQKERQFDAVKAERDEAIRLLRDVFYGRKPQRDRYGYARTFCPDDKVRAFLDKHSRKEAAKG